MRSRLMALSLSLLTASAAWGQHSTGTLTQTVNQRGTVTELTASPTTGINVGSNVTFTALLDTAGAPAVTSESITFKDGTTVLGSGTLSQVSTTNLLPYSLNFAQWTKVNGQGQLTVAANATAPDGTSNGATTVVLPSNNTGIAAGISYGVAGTAYANTSLTFSVWLASSTVANVNIQLTDYPQSVVSQSHTCAVSATWTRCSFTVAMPANAGTGFAASITEPTDSGQQFTVWGAQVEQAASEGPYVQTVGAAAAGQGGLATYATSSLLEGSHSITAIYGGDTNYIASTSNALVLNVGRATPSISLTQGSTSTTYGASVTFTATLSGPDTTPTGTVTFMSGATVLGTGTLSNGVATFATSSLPGGTSSITAVYGGDTNFNTVTSTAVSHTVTLVSSTMTVTSSEDPSVYGDSVTFTITVVGSGAVPTGTVTITDGATTLGTVTLDGTGTATFVTNAMTAGSHSITATYSGDVNYN